MLNIKSTISNTSIFCTVPIQTENLKKYFIDKTVNFQIDYSKSKLHTDKFLIYLSNLGVPVDLSPDIPIEHGRFTDLKILSLIK